MIRTDTDAPTRLRTIGPRVARLLFVAVWLVAACGTDVATAVAQPAAPLPEITEPVTDLANVVDPASKASLERLSRSLQQATGDVVVVVTVPTVDPYADIRAYAVKLFENHGRGIGTRGQDNGVLILLAVRERRVWVEVGYGLEQWITDGFAGQTSREDMVPSFRAGAYGQGLVNGTARIVRRIAQARDATLTDVPTPQRRPARRGTGAPLWLILLFFIVVALLSRAGGGPGGRRGIRRWGRHGGWVSGVGPFGGSFGG
ncbi:MAG: YgcG family protein, partial [Vicinamibacterales bacterium]